MVLSDYRITDISTILQEEDSLGFDHVPISISLKTEKMIYKKMSNRISSIKTYWTTYRDLMEGHYETLVLDLKGTAIDKYNRLISHNGINIKKTVFKYTFKRRNVSK